MHLQVAGVVWNVGLNLHLHFLEESVGITKFLTVANSFVVSAGGGMPADLNFEGL